MRSLGLAAATLPGCGQIKTSTPDQPDASVKRVLVMFKCHLDVGFTDTQANVMRKYFDQYYPLAMQVARAMRDSGEDRYIWTTGSWLPYEYLEQANTEQRKRMDAAIRAGDIAWHALPFSWQTEALDRSMISGALGLSQSLDKRFGRRTAGAKMSDVPGHSRGLIAPLSEAAIKLLDIGVNSASTPPEVPPLFVWKNPQGASLIVLYHLHSYGGVVQVPGSDLAIAVMMRNDNAGPHTLPEIRNIYAGLRKRFPNATVSAANLTDIAEAVDKFGDSLPVVTEEIGDTWIYGLPSDPVKVARYREVARLRREWIAAKHFQVGDETDCQLLRRLALAAEHTWGTDTKRYLDYDHYTPSDLAKVINERNYKVMQFSWAEKRKNIDDAVDSLPPALRSQATERLDKLRPVEPSLAGLKPRDPAATLETAHFQLAFDPQTGAIRALQAKAGKRDWASREHPIALFSYQTLSKADYDRFLASYILSKADWAPKDFGKPNIEHFGAQSRVWLPKITSAWAARERNAHRVIAQLAIHDPEAEHSGLVAWPRKMYLELLFPDAEPAIEINFSWFDKAANRLPEALWLSFIPAVSDARAWMLEKVDQPVSPFDVRLGGNRHMHAISGKMHCKDARGAISIETLDAPVIALGAKSAVFFSTAQPKLEDGIHFSLFNNGWGTNYPQWFGENVRSRFKLVF